MAKQQGTISQSVPYVSAHRGMSKNMPVQLCVYQILPSSRFKEETSNRHFLRLNVLLSDLCQLVLGSLHVKLLIIDSLPAVP